MSAMVETGRAHTPAGGSMHAEKDYNPSEKSSVSSNIHSVSDLLKERLVHREDDGADKLSPNGDAGEVSGAEYISHSGIETSHENGVHELTSMVSRHVSMMGGYANDDAAESSNVLRGMLRGKNGSDTNSGARTDSVNSGGMISKLLQRDPNNESSSTARGANSSYDIDVDGDSSMPSITTPNEFSDDDMSDRSPSAFMDEDEEFNEELNASGSSSSKSNKRARVENIINSMNRSSSPVKETPVTPIDQRRHKRKQYIPQQHDSRTAVDSDPEPEAKVRRLEEDALQKQLKMMQDQLVSMQHQATMDGDIDLAEVERRCHQRQMIINGMQEKESKIQELSKRHGLLGPVEIDSSPFVREARKMVDGKFAVCKTQISPLTGDTPKDLESLAVMLKHEIRHSVGTLVDNVVARFVEETKRIHKDQHSPPQTATVPVVEPTATELPSPAKEKPAQPEPAKTPTQAPAPRQPTPPPPPQPQQQQQQPQQPPVLSHSIHKITNNNNNNNEIKPITIAPKQNAESAFSPEKQSPLPRIEQPKPTRTKVTDKIIHPFFDHPKPSFADLLRHAPLFPPPPYFHQFPHPMPPMFHHHHPPQPKISNEPEPEQTEALALVVNTPKKKRTKVTDTRLSPRAARALLQEPVPTASHDPSNDGPSNHFNNGEFNHHHPHALPHSEPGMLPIHPNLLPSSLPTSVAIPNPSLQHSDILGNMYGSHQDHPATFPDFGGRVSSTSRSPSVRDHGSPSMHPHDYGMFGRSGDSSNGDMFDNEACTNMDGFPMTSTLTPMHLRKAKLMFFFTRYPSSSILKVYFPDIKFNKNNTAQLVKWFSNFREFYYIQMEKYSRQALAEGVKNPEDLIVTTDSEIYRVLNLHYNRNNQLEVPESFRVVVQATLREFFKSIQAGKDTEQSWKKAIYKVIARMDDSLPEYFKSPNWMEQLNDN